jgi:hypothetical protein
LKAVGRAEPPDASAVSHEDLANELRFEEAVPDDSGSA